jgi:hypothetical protein
VDELAVEEDIMGRSSVLVLLVFLVGCFEAEEQPSAPPASSPDSPTTRILSSKEGEPVQEQTMELTRAQLIGEYRKGDGYVNHYLSLKKDGTFHERVMNCKGLASTADGSWAIARSGVKLKIESGEGPAELLLILITEGRWSLVSSEHSAKCLAGRLSRHDRYDKR